MKFTVYSVGRERADAAAPLTADYLGRISKFFPIEETILRQDRDDKIAARILQKAAGDLIVALDERGKTMDSHQFSSLIGGWMNTGVAKISFVIGGAEGLPDEIRQKANLLLSLSKMTLPHRLAKLFLTEQLYRGLCILRNIPYQK